MTETPLLPYDEHLARILVLGSLRGWFRRPELGVHCTGDADDHRARLQVLAEVRGWI